MSFRTLSILSVQLLKVVFSIETLSRFSEILGEHYNRHCRVTPSIKFAGTHDHLNECMSAWREALLEYSFLLENTTQCPRPGPLDPALPAGGKI